jgi:hypothetical protein
VTETDGRADDAAGADDAADAGPGVPDAPPDVPDAASRDARSKAADADVAAYWDG